MLACGERYFKNKISLSYLASVVVFWVEELAQRREEGGPVLEITPGRYGSDEDADGRPDEGWGVTDVGQTFRLDELCDLWGEVVEVSLDIVF